MRQRNTTKLNGSFSEATIDLVWKKGKITTGYDADTYRKDTCGAWMKRTDYGNTSSKYGWEIDHIKPVAEGGTDDLDNLQPLYWENNRHKGDDWPKWSCAVSSKT